MSTLIVLGHKARSGKDEVARYLDRLGFKRLAFADPLKAVVAVVFPGVTLEMLHNDALKMQPVAHWPSESPVRMCQRIAQGIRSEYGQDFWGQVARLYLEAMGFFQAGSTLKIVITDMRTPAEAELVKAWGGFAVRVQRPREQRGEIGRPEDHWTEVALDPYTGWDHTIENDEVGLLRLQAKTDDMLKALGVWAE